MQMLSVNCSKCGATNKFPDTEIPSFCSFCGSALPDMKPFVEEAIRINQTRQYHEMNMELADKEIRKERIKGSVNKIRSISDFIGNVAELIKIIILLITVGFFVFMILKQFVF